MWQFLQRMSHTTATYEQQQRNWALHVDNEPPIVVEQAAPVPAVADLVSVIVTVLVADDLVAFVAPAETVALVPISGQMRHAYNLQGLNLLLYLLKIGQYSFQNFTQP